MPIVLWNGPIQGCTQKNFLKESTVYYSFEISYAILKIKTFNNSTLAIRWLQTKHWQRQIC